MPSRRCATSVNCRVPGVGLRNETCGTETDLVVELALLRLWFSFVAKHATYFRVSCGQSFLVISNSLTLKKLELIGWPVGDQQKTW